MEILDFCVKKLQSTEAEKFELCFEKSSSLSIDVHDGKVDHLARATDEGLAIRVLSRQRVGFSYTYDLSHQAIERAITTALDIAKLMPPDEYNDLCGVSAKQISNEDTSGFCAAPYPVVENYDQSGLEVSLEQKIELARSLEANALKVDPRIKRVRKSVFEEVSGETVMLDFNGEMIKHRATVFGAELLCVAEQGDDAEMGYDSYSANYFDQFDTKRMQDVAYTAAKESLQLLGGTLAPTMVCPAIFKNSVTAQLLSFLSGSFSAENIDKQSSLLVGKLREKLFADCITIIDDGLLANATGSSPFDGEGVPSRATTLVEHGMITNFLYDTYYARKHGVETTASSRRGSLKSPPSIGPSNIYMKKGPLSLEKNIAAISNGIFITDLMGLHTANPITGDFSVGASGILIEGGKLTQPVKGFAIAGNLVELLRNVSAVGSDLKFWGSLGAPSLVVSQLSIGGA